MGIQWGTNSLLIVDYTQLANHYPTPKRIVVQECLCRWKCQNIFYLIILISYLFAFIISTKKINWVYFTYFFFLNLGFKNKWKSLLTKKKKKEVFQRDAKMSPFFRASKFINMGQFEWLFLERFLQLGFFKNEPTRKGKTTSLTWDLFLMRSKK